MHNALAIPANTRKDNIGTKNKKEEGKPRKNVNKDVKVNNDNISN